MSGAAREGELLTDEQFLVLNAIYLRKMAGPEHVAEVAQIDLAQSKALLADAETSGLTIDVGGQAMLGDEGRARVLAYYAAAYAAVRADPAAQEWYRKFETVNAQFIKLVTEWQKSDGDERVQERLVRLVERQVGALRELARSVPRYETYAVRFERGLDKIDGGQRDFVCKPTVDSVHNVWFEFHEDILAVMGRPRES